MCRTLALLALIGFMAGCTTRYGTNPTGGPFARKPKSDTDTTIPSAPVANNSPLALGTPLQPNLVATEENPIVPPRPPESIRLAGGDNVRGVAIQTNGLDYGDASAAAFPPWRRRGGDPQPDQLPSPFAPQDPPGVIPAGGKGTAASAPSPPPGPSLAALNIAEVKKLATIAVEKWAKVDTYEAIVTRRELNPSKEMTEDVVLTQYRKEPMSVFMRNIGESGKGREILYNPSKYGDKIYIMIGEGDNRLFKAGFKPPPLSPDNPQVKERTRYSIRDAGYGTPIAKVANWVTKAETGKIPPDALTFLGPVERKEFPYPLIGVSLKLRPGDEATMPNGGTRQWFFDPNADSTSFGWPVLIIATEPNGKEVEYYLFEKVKLQVRFNEADFVPERLGKK
jgi:hypothetical protein